MAEKYKAAFLRAKRIALISMAINLVLVAALIVSMCMKPTISAIDLPSETALACDLTQETETQPKCLGEYTVMAYCPCKKCCGVWSAEHPSKSGTDYVQKTASGTIPTEGRTIAADTSVLPFGTVIVIDGHEYIVEDRGGAIKGKRIDIFFESHDAALNWGKQTKNIYVKGDR